MQMFPPPGADPLSKARTAWEDKCNVKRVSRFGARTNASTGNVEECFQRTADDRPGVTVNNSPSMWFLTTSDASPLVPGNGVARMFVGGPSSPCAHWGVDPSTLTHVTHAVRPIDASTSSSISPSARLGTPVPSPRPLASSPLRSAVVYFPRDSRICQSSEGSSVSGTSSSAASAGDAAVPAEANTWDQRVPSCCLSR